MAKVPKAPKSLEMQKPKSVLNEEGQKARGPKNLKFLMPSLPA